MNNIKISVLGTSPAIGYAAQVLTAYGYDLNTSKATHILLDIPSRELPDIEYGNVTVIGGNLQLPCPVIDLLQDPVYLAKNAMITAHCAIRIASQEAPYILPEGKILVIGWGRIGKCLSHLLQQLGCHITVAARKASDRAMLAALGCNTIPTNSITLEDYSIIFNTVPQLLIENCDTTAVVIDLASTPGISGQRVISARGLPGKMAPVSSGQLIADTIHRLLNRKEPEE